MARILVVDDEPYARTYMRRVLERGGHEVSEAGDSHQAMKSIREQPQELIIMDLIMPHGRGMDGITACRKEFPAVKIIAVSGVAAYLSVAESVGAHVVLEKPINKKTLLKAIASLLPNAEE